MALAVASARVLMAPAAGPAHDQDFVDLDLMLDDRDDPPGDGGGANEGGSAGAGYACAVCHKAFEKRTSRDRHVRRCRRKKPEDTVPRKKACDHCAASKARCDLARPSCARCRSKVLPCVYAAARRAPSPPDDEPIHNAVRSPSHPYHHQQHARQHSLGSLHFDDSILQGIDLAALDGPWSLGASPGGPGFAAGSSGSITTDDLMLPPETPGITELITRRGLSYLGSPEYPHVEAVGRLLGAFPGMMRRPRNPPPFIHRTQVREGNRRETLGIAISLIGLWFVRAEESRKFVWATIKSEWERQEKKFDKNEFPTELDRLEALQAILLYSLLMYFDTSPPPGATVDERMIRKLEACSLKLGVQDIIWPSPEAGGISSPYYTPAWSDWIIIEAKRRTICTLFLFDRIYHIRRGLTPFSCVMLGEMPLPAVRSVWEATDEAVWADELVLMLKETAAAARSSRGGRSDPPTPTQSAAPSPDSFQYQHQREAIASAIAKDDCPLRMLEPLPKPAPPGSLEAEREWVRLKDLWADEPKMTPWYAGIDALGSAIMADTVMGRRREMFDGMQITPWASPMCVDNGK